MIKPTNTSKYDLKISNNNMYIFGGNMRGGVFFNEKHQLLEYSLNKICMEIIISLCLAKLFKTQKIRVMC